MPEVVNFSASEAQQLYQEKIAQLRREMAEFQRQAQVAIGERDKATHDVTTLSQERASMVKEIETFKQQAAQMKVDLASHRSNVERSVNAQVEQAQVTLDAAEHAKVEQTTRQQALDQLKAQLVGIKQTYQQELITSLLTIQKSIQAAQT